MELRVALALRGGVSLAVWIGGAVAEIDLVRRSGPRYAPGAAFVPRRAAGYRALLAECGFEALEVDVLAGASAGGLNATLYGTALCAGTSIDGLGDVWVQVGALWRILRRTGGPDTQSLLDGDGYFAPQLQDRLVGLAAGPRRDELVRDAVSLDLSATVLDADATADPGARDGRGHIHLARRDVPPTNPLSDLPGGDEVAAHGPVLAALAYAGRTTSSFPGAFEPATIASSVDDASPLEPPSAPAPVPSEPRVPVGMSRWFGVHRAEPDRAPFRVIDGGVLDNIPVDRALRAIRSAPADGPTARALLFLDPAPAPPPGPARPEPARRFTTIASVLSRVGAVRATGERLSDEIEQIRAHNDRVEQVRARLTSALASGPVTPSAANYLDFRATTDAVRWAALLAAPDYGQLRSPYRPVVVDAVQYPDTRVLHDALVSGHRSDPGALRCDPWALEDAAAVLIDACGARQRSGAALPTGTKARLYRVRLTARVMQQRREQVFLRAWRDGRSASSVERAHAAVAAVVRLASPGRPLPAGGPLAAVLEAVPAATEPAFLGVLGDYVIASQGSPASGDRHVTEAAWALLAAVRTDLGSVDDAYRCLADPGSALSDVVAGLAAADAVPATASTIDFRVVGSDRALPRERVFGPLLALERARRIGTILRDDTPSLPAGPLLSTASKLAGNEVRNFSGFLAADWRRNDWRWGRLDAAGATVELVLDQGAPSAAGMRRAATAFRTGALPPRRPSDAAAETPQAVAQARADLLRAVVESAAPEIDEPAGGTSAPPFRDSVVGQQGLRDLRPVYLTGLAARAADLAWWALLRSARARRSVLAGGLTALVVLARPLVALLPLGVNAVRAGLVAATLFAMCAVLTGPPGATAPTLGWGSTGLLVLALLGVVTGGVLLLVVGRRQESRWRTLIAGVSDLQDKQEWARAYARFRRRARPRAAGLWAAGLATTVVPGALALSCERGVVLGACVTLAVVGGPAWCYLAWRVAGDGPPERIGRWYPRDRMLRWVGIVAAAALFLVGLGGGHVAAILRAAVDPVPFAPVVVAVTILVVLLVMGLGWADPRWVLGPAVLVALVAAALVAWLPNAGVLTASVLAASALASFLWRVRTVDGPGDDTGPGTVADLEAQAGESGQLSRQ